MFLFKFRGRSLNKKYWYYGDYAQGRIFCNSGVHPIDPLTVGCFTGFQDCDGKEIYEDDIVQGLYLDVLDKPIGIRRDLYVIKRYPKKATFKPVCIGWDVTDNWFEKKSDHFVFPGGEFSEETAKYRYKVVGNIFDNRDLLEAYTKEKQEEHAKEAEEWFKKLRKDGVVNGSV